MTGEQRSSDAKSDELTKNPLTAGAAPSAWRSGPLVGTCWALAAGLVAWLLVQTVHPVFATTEGADQWGFLPLDVQWRLDRNNSMLVLGVVGGLTACALAIGEGASRRSWQVVLIGGAACAAAGLAAGGLGGYLGHRVFEVYKANAEISDLTKAVLVNGVMFTTLGAGVGLGAGALLGGCAKALRGLFGGLLAGVLASVLYPVIVAALMPTAMTSVLLPLEIGERLLWFGLITGLLGAFIPEAARDRVTARSGLATAA